MIVLSLFIIGHMELFFYTEKGSIISVAGVPTTDIIEPFFMLCTRQKSSSDIVNLPYYLVLPAVSLLSQILISIEYYKQIE